jgi:hypothetical protein
MFELVSFLQAVGRLLQAQLKQFSLDSYNTIGHLLVIKRPNIRHFGQSH